MKTRESCTFN